MRLLTKKTTSAAIVLLILSASSSSFASETAQAKWSYAGETGPTKWGGLSSEYALCQSGKRQSPINIIPSVAKPAALYSLAFNYKPVTLQVLNNGHTLQANYHRKASDHSITIDGKKYPIKSSHQYDSKLKIGDDSYELLQFHYHSPSEHQLASNGYPMEMHLVHQNASGNIAVVGIMLREGEADKTLQLLLDNASKTPSPAVVLNDIKINAKSLLPDNKEVFHYTGSLTEPPCSENVNWYLMANSKTVSAAQVSAFNKLIGDNARPLQKLNWRNILVTQ